MPNHTANLLEVQGPSAKVILDDLQNPNEKDHLFDFNQVIPMPECLQIGSAPFLGDDDTVENLQKIIDDPESKEYQVDNAKTKLQMLDNIQTTGYGSWYGWSVNNWGTKWNAYDTYRNDETSLYFETAWSPPEPVIQALSRKHPDHVFTLKYADEGGGFLGYTVYRNGNFEETSVYWSDDEGIALREELGRYYPEYEEEEV